MWIPYPKRLVVKGGPLAAAVGVRVRAAKAATTSAASATAATEASAITTESTATATETTATATTTETSAVTTKAATASAEGATVAGALGPGGTGLGKVKANLTAVYGLAVHGVHGSLGLVSGLELDITVSLVTPGLLVGDNAGSDDTGAGIGELLGEPVAVDVEGQATDKEGGGLGLALHRGAKVRVGLSLLGGGLGGLGGGTLLGLLLLALFLILLGLLLRGSVLGHGPGLSGGLGGGFVRGADLVTVGLALAGIRVDAGLVALRSAGIRVRLASANLRPRLALRSTGLRLRLALADLGLALLRGGGLGGRLVLLAFLGGGSLGGNLLQLSLGLDNVLVVSALLGDLQRDKSGRMHSYGPTLVSGLVMSERRKKWDIHPGRGQVPR